MDGFDLIAHIGPDAPSAALAARCAGRLERVAAPHTPSEPRIGELLGHRAALALAASRGAETLLVLQGAPRFLDRAGPVLAAAMAELAPRDWQICHLGGWWPEEPVPLAGCHFLASSAKVAELCAVAYHRRVFAALLAEWPASVAEAASRIDQVGGLARLLRNRGPAHVVRPAVVTLPALLPGEPAALQRRYQP